MQDTIRYFETEQEAVMFSDLRHIGKELAVAK